MSLALSSAWWRSPLVARLAAVCLLLASLSAVLPWLWRDTAGRNGLLLIELAVVVGVGLLSVRSLLPVTLVLVVLAAEALGVFGVHANDDLPFVQLATVRLTIRDGLLIGALPLAVVKLWQRREAPVLLRPYLLVVAAIAVAFMLGVVMDGDIKAPFSELRPLFAYALYPIIVAAVTTRRELMWFLGTVFAVALTAVGIQVLEAANGTPFPWLAPPLVGNAQALAGIGVGGKHVPYIWNRALWHLFLTLVLALGCLIEGRAVVRYGLLAVACAIGFIIMLSRSWYIFIAVATLTVLVFEGNWLRRARFMGALVLTGVALVGLLMLLEGLVGQQYGGSLIGVWQGRVATLQQFQQDSSYQIRVQELAAQWDAVLESPVLGYGFSLQAQNLIALGNLDTGAVNTLVWFGFVGALPFFALSLYATWRCIRLARRLPVSWERGCALGLVGGWAGTLAGAAFNYDMFTFAHGAWLVVLALATGDRLERLALAGAPRKG